MKVYVYLVQHAEAKREEEDPARPLSEKGWRDLERITEFLKVKGIKVSRILHSGKLRAKQTAEKLIEAINSIEGIREVNGLAPLDDPKAWFERLKEIGEDIMLVGHLPHLSRLSGLLLLNDPDQRVVEFKPGGVLCLGRDEKGKWSIEWMIVP